MTKPDLTPQLLQVLQLTAQGQTAREVGDTLGLTENTIKTHLRRLFLRLHARDRAHAVALGCAWGLVDLTRIAGVDRGDQ